MPSFSHPFLTLVPDADAAPAEQFFPTAWEDTRGWDSVPGWAPASPVETPSRSAKPSWDDTPASPEAWRADALCAETDPEAFFPEKGGSTRDAKRVCAGCPVRAECLEFALAGDERFGIWGGLSERERRKLKKRAV